MPKYQKIKSVALATLCLLMGGFMSLPTGILAQSTPAYSTTLSSYLDGTKSVTTIGMTRDVAFDSQGNLYVAGGTQARDFQTTAGAYDETYNTGGKSTGTFGDMDVFLMKFSPTGTLLWSTLIGGGNYDRAYAVEVGPNDDVFVAGRAGEGYPTTAGTVQPNFLNNAANDAGYASTYGRQNGFVTKFDKDGKMQWSTYMTAGVVRDIDVDNQGNVHIAPTQSKIPNPHITANAFQKSNAGSWDGMYVKISPDAKTLLYGTYIGGSGDDGSGPAVRVDAAGNAYYNAVTTSTNFPLKNAFQTKFGGGTNDMVAVKFAADGSLVYSSYFGGNGIEGTETHGVAIDAAGNAYMGVTSFSNNVVIKNGFGTKLNGTADALIAKISPTGQLLASTYVGGSNADSLQGVVFDNTRQQLVFSGITQSSGMATAGAIDTTLGGTHDALITILSADLTQKLYATYVGGSGDEEGRTIDVNEATGKIAIGGQTTSSDFPLKLSVDPALNSKTSAMFSVISPSTSTVIDTDKDTIADTVDNCPTTANLDQANFDKDTQGDACDTDDDNDGILDTAEKSGCIFDASLTCGGTTTPVATSTFTAGTVIQAVGTINVRTGAFGTVLGTQTNNALGTVLIDAPVKNGIYTYINVNFATGVDGWVADAFVAKTNVAPTSTPTLPVVTLFVSPTTVTAGNSATLAWSTTNATACTATGDWSGAKTVSGTQSTGVLTAGTKSYGLTCTGAGGSTNKTVSVTANAAPTATTTPVATSTKTIVVSTNAELSAEITKAKGGETIMLNPGTYNAFRVQNMNYAAPVTITSANPNNRAIAKGIAILASTNVTVDGLDFKYTYASSDVSYKRVNEINNSKNIIIKNSNFTGDVDATGFGALIGVAIRWSSDVTLDNNVIKNWNIGLINSQSSRVTINNNEFTQMSGDGMENTEMKFLTISNNYIHDFLRDPKSNMHPDMIQFWTMGTKNPSTDVTIKGNRLDIGNGSWTQSIFMRNEVVDMGTLPGSVMNYRNFTVENNTITNLHLHGITLGEADGVVIRNNTLTSAVRTITDPTTVNYLKQYSANNGIYVPMINLGTKFGSKNVLVENNSFTGGQMYPATASRLNGYNNQSDWTLVGNTINGVPIKNSTSTTTPTATSTNPAPVVTLAVASTAITVGNSTTLTWGAVNATACTATGDWSGAKTVSGSVSTGALTVGTKSYGLVCTGTGGSTTKSVSVVVTATPAATTTPGVVSPFAAGSRVQTVGTVNVRATAGGTLLGTQANASIGTVLVNTPVKSGDSTFINVNFDSGIDGWVADSLLIKAVVVTPPTPTAPTLTFLTNTTSVVTGSKATLTWSSTGATTCVGSGTWGTAARTISGTFTTDALNTVGTKAYSLTCTGLGGSVTKSLNIVVTSAPIIPVDTDKDTIADTVDNCPTTANLDQANFDKDTQGDACDTDDDNDGILDAAEKSGCILDASLVCGAPAAPTLTFVANNVNVVSGSKATLTWSSTGATTCVGSGTWGTATRAVNGTFTTDSLIVPGTKPYSLTCTGAGGSVTKSVDVVVSASNEPTLTLSATPTVLKGGSATVTWSSTNVTSCTASGEWQGVKETSGTYVKSGRNWLGAEVYTLTCTGSNGSITKSATSTVVESLSKASSISPLASGTAIQAKVKTTDTVRVRMSPNGLVLGLQPTQAIGTLTSTTETKLGDFTWVYVDFATGIDGYVAKEYTAIIK